MGDRFAHQAAAQLRACQLAAQHGVDVVPVWNKSNREHTFIGSEPQSVFDAAQAAVQRLVDELEGKPPAALLPAAQASPPSSPPSS